MMKTQKVLFPLLCMLLSCTAYAQDAITVNGLEIGKQYTQTQIIAALGQPSVIRAPQEDDVSENYYIYKYNTNTFDFVDGQFHSFTIRDNAFAVNNILRVGDHISKIDQMGGVKKEDTPSQTGGYIYWRPSSAEKFDFIYLTADYSLQTKIITIIDCAIYDL